MNRLRVSDHALLRFLERGAGLDVEGLREALETALARAHHAAREVGEADFLVTIGGHCFVVRRVVHEGEAGDVVTSVIEERGGARHFRTLGPRSEGE